MRQIIIIMVIIYIYNNTQSVNSLFPNRFNQYKEKERKVKRIKKRYIMKIEEEKIDID